MSTCGIPDPSSYIPPTPCPLVPFTPPANIPAPSTAQVVELAATGSDGVHLLVVVALIALIGGVFLVGFLRFRAKHKNDAPDDQPIADYDEHGQPFQWWEKR